MDAVFLLFSAPEEQASGKFDALTIRPVYLRE